MPHGGGFGNGNDFGKPGGDQHPGLYEFDGHRSRSVYRHRKPVVKLLGKPITRLRWPVPYRRRDGDGNADCGLKPSDRWNDNNQRNDWMSDGEFEPGRMLEFD